MKRFQAVSAILAALFLFTVFPLSAQQNKAALTVRANVSGAVVSVNGIDVGTTTPNFAILLDAGAYNLRVSRQGYTDFMSSVTLPPDSLIVNVELAPLQMTPGPGQGPGQGQGQAGYSFARVFAGAGEILRGAARGPDKFVVVGNNQTILYSREGRNWTMAPKPANGTNFTNVFWAQDRYIATGDYGAIHMSMDGVNWTRLNSGTSSHLSAGLRADGKYYITGQNGLILVSTDGMQWTSIRTGHSSNFFNIARGDPGLVITGAGGLILYSRDGNTWSRVESGVTDNLSGLAWGRDVFVAGGSNQNASIIYSKDGRNWKVAYRSSTPQTRGVIHWTGERFLAGGSKGSLLASSDGTSWTEVQGLPPESNSAALATGAGITILAESNGGILASSTAIRAPSIPLPPVPTPAPPGMSPASLLKEGFEGPAGQDGMPAGWVERNNLDPADKTAWQVFAEAGKSHGGSRYIRTVFASNKILITPPVMLPAGTLATLSFWARSEDRQALENVTVLLSSGGTSQTDFSTTVGTASKVPAEYTRYEYSLAAYAGRTVRLAFQVKDPGNHYILDLDDIEVAIPSGAAGSLPGGTPGTFPAGTPVGTPGGAPPGGMVIVWSTTTTTTTVPPPPPVVPARSIPATVYWHMPDTSDLYLNGTPLRACSPDFRSRGDESSQAAFSARVLLKTGDVFTVGTRRGGSYGFMLVAVDDAGKVIWKTDASTWRAYSPNDEIQWFRPEIAAASRSMPTIVQKDPWYPQIDLNKRTGNVAQSVWGDPNSLFAYLFSTVRLAESVPASFVPPVATTTIPAGPGMGGPGMTGPGSFGPGPAGPSDGSPGAPVRLSLYSSFEGRIGRYKPEEKDLVSRETNSYYVFYAPTRGNYRIQVSAVSGKKTTTPAADLDFFLYNAPDWRSLEARTPGDEGFPIVQIDTGGKDYYLRVMNADAGNLTYTIVVYPVF